MVLVMTAEVSSQTTSDWTQFNSSLLIEVTRPAGKFFCSGVAVSKQLVLTAAHCLDGEVQQVRIFNQSTYDPANPYFEVQSWVLHPEYNARVSNYHMDLGRIVLKHPLPQDVIIHPVYQGNNINGKFVRFGFGARDGANVRTVVTPLYRGMDWDDDTLMLDDMYSRSGDSGGPVFLQRGIETYVLAIHSTLSHGPQGSFSMNPLLRHHIKWIYQN